MKIQAIWATPARIQLAEIMDHIAINDPRYAIELDEKIDKTVLRLGQFPNSGRKGRLSGTREAIVDSYILVYEVAGDYLLITQIVHGAREFPTKRY